MTGNTFNYNDRFIDKKELKKLVPYSSTHIARLEKLGLFPKRIKIGPCRVAWSLNAVLAWMASKVHNITDLQEKQT